MSANIRWSTGLLVVTTLSSLAACGDQPTVLRSPESSARVSRTADTRRRAAGIDSVLLSFADRIPGFGTFYIDSADNVVVRLKDRAHESAAANAVIGFLNASRRRVRPVRFETTPFDFSELNDYVNRVTDHLGLPELPSAWSVGISKKAGVVEILIADAASTGKVAAAAAALGIPGAAVRITQMDRPVRANSIRDWSNPLVGGLGTGRPVGYVQDAECTLGYIASDGVRQGFITASHCSKVPFGPDGPNVDNTYEIYQPGSWRPWGGQRLSMPEWKLGVEFNDVSPFTSAQDAYWCPHGQCRWSDAAFFVIQGQGGSSTLYNRTVAFPWVAAAISRATMLDTINTSNPWFQRPAGQESWPIIQEFTYPIEGDVVDKMGQRTGWSSGSVVRTCYRDVVSGDGVPGPLIVNLYLVCQDQVYTPNSSFAWEGDSGAPVFYYNYYPSTPPSVVALGVLWGVYVTGTYAGQSFWLSNLRGIRFDLGTINVY